MSKKWVGTGLPREELDVLYRVEGRSITDIAREVGCSKSTVWLDLRKKGIQTRPTTAGPRIYPYITLTEDQEQLILGGLLGDCGCELPAGNSNPRLYFSHSVKNWKYLYWKYRLLAPSGLVKNPPSTLWGTDQAGKEFLQLRFVTISHPVLKPYAELFYPEGKKVLPMRALTILKPLGLGVWFGDDGSLSYPYQAYLSTESFSWQENVIIQQWFAEKWGLEMHVYSKKTSGGAPFLGLSKMDQVSRLLDLLTPIPPSKNMVKGEKHGKN